MAHCFRLSLRFAVHLPFSKSRQVGVQESRASLRDCCVSAELQGAILPVQVADELTGHDDYLITPVARVDVIVEAPTGRMV